MKLVLIACFALAADAALSTIRLGPRKQIREEKYEFGRPALDFHDVEEAFKEIQFIQMRMLGVESYGLEPGMSFPLQPVMSFPLQPGMPMGTPPPTPSSSPLPVAESTGCAPPNLTGNPSTDITLQLNVETLSGGTAFVQDLAQGVASVAASSFSLCQPYGDRMLWARRTEESKVSGLEASNKTGISANEFCQANTGGASCSVVNVVLTVYSGDKDSTAAAGQEVYDELVERIEDGVLVNKYLNNDDIVAVRLEQNDGTVDSGSNDEGDEEPSPGSWETTGRTATISVLSVVAVSAIVVLLYRRKMLGDDAGSDDDSKRDSSTITGGHTAQPTVFTENSPNHV